MAIKKYKPTTPGRRGMTGLTLEEMPPGVLGQRHDGESLPSQDRKLGWKEGMMKRKH